MIEIDFENLEKKQLSEDDLIVRELLNLCSGTYVDIEKVVCLFKNLRARHLIKAFKEVENDENLLLNDMALFEFLYSNTLSTPESIEDGDEIYV